MLGKEPLKIGIKDILIEFRSIISWVLGIVFMAIYLFTDWTIIYALGMLFLGIYSGLLMERRING